MQLKRGSHFNLVSRRISTMLKLRYHLIRMSRALLNLEEPMEWSTISFTAQQAYLGQMRNAFMQLNLLVELYET